MSEDGRCYSTTGYCFCDNDPDFHKKKGKKSHESSYQFVSGDYIDRLHMGAVSIHRDKPMFMEMLAVAQRLLKERDAALEVAWSYLHEIGVDRKQPIAEKHERAQVEEDVLSLLSPQPSPRGRGV